MRHPLPVCVVERFRVLEGITTSRHGAYWRLKCSERLGTRRRAKAVRCRSCTPWSSGQRDGDRKPGVFGQIKRFQQTQGTVLVHCWYSNIHGHYLPRSWPYSAPFLVTSADPVGGTTGPLIPASPGLASQCARLVAASGSTRNCHRRVDPSGARGRSPGIRRQDTKTRKWRPPDSWCLVAPVAKHQSTRNTARQGAALTPSACIGSAISSPHSARTLARFTSGASSRAPF